MGYITIDDEKFYVESMYYESTYKGNKKYRERNRDKINARQNKNRRRKRELSENYEKYKTEIKCICGTTYIHPYNTKRHLKTKKHTKFINRMENSDKEQEELSTVLDLSMFDTEDDEIIPLKFLQ
jgi:hypothetical protein